VLVDRTDILTVHVQNILFVLYCGESTHRDVRAEWTGKIGRQTRKGCPTVTKKFYTTEEKRKSQVIKCKWERYGVSSKYFRHKSC